jgi:hypothetical protein
MNTTDRYQFTPDMREISGFGGGYEQLCRDMLAAGLSWLDEHPSADPQFHGYPGITGIVCEDNDDARALTAAIVAPTDGDCTGAMHHAVVRAAMWIKANGWDAYVAAMTHPGGRDGILADKLADVEQDRGRAVARRDTLRADVFRRGEILDAAVPGWPWQPSGVAEEILASDDVGTHPDDPERRLAAIEADYRRVLAECEVLTAERNRRGEIIAEKVLGWKKHPTHPGSAEQIAYGPSAEYVLENILPGDWLTRFVNEAIEAM